MSRRNNTGVFNPRAKLHEHEVLAIRASREPLKALARHYRISTRNVQAIRYGETWRHLSPTTSPTGAAPFDPPTPPCATVGDSAGGG